MKKLAIGFIALALFSVLLSVIQMSCQQTVTASPQALNGSTTNIGIVLVALNDSTLLTMKYDGTDVKQVPIVMPSQKVMQGYTAKLSPDGTKVFFMAYQKGGGSSKDLFVANIDGTELKSIASGSGYLLQPY